MNSYYINGVKQVYTGEEIRKRIEENADEILKYVTEERLKYLKHGAINEWEQISVLYSMKNGLLFTIHDACKLTEEGEEKWDEGTLVEVDYFESNILFYGVLELPEVQRRLKRKLDEDEDSAVRFHIENCMDYNLLLNEERF